MYHKPSRPGLFDRMEVQSVSSPSACLESRSIRRDLISWSPVEQTCFSIGKMLAGRFEVHSPDADNTVVFIKARVKARRKWLQGCCVSGEAGPLGRPEGLGAVPRQEVLQNSARQTLSKHLSASTCPLPSML